MFLLVLVGGIAASAVAVASRQLRRVGRIGPRGGEELVRALSVDGSEPLASLLESVFPDADTALLECVIRESRSASAFAVAEVNERLGEVERELSAVSDVPRAALRVSLFSGTAGAVVEVASGISDGHARAWVSALMAFAIGVMGALSCFEISRRSLVSANARRLEWDRVGMALTRRLAPLLESAVPISNLRSSRRETRAEGRGRSRRPKRSAPGES